MEEATTKEQIELAFSPDTTSWINPLIELREQAVKDGKKLIVIVIARKMARLMEYHLKLEYRLSELFSFKDDGEHSPIITEHAIPCYLHGSEYYNRNEVTGNPQGKKPEIVILDDLIVYGDTVETVSENVYAQTGIEPKILAMASTKELEPNFDFATLHESVKSNILSQDDVPSFTAKCSRDILSLKGSMDMEHTILDITLDKDKIQNLKENLEKELQECFPSALVYKIVHPIPVSWESENKIHDEAINITVCFTKDSDKINNDFNKLRFFIGDDKLKIVSYAPNIWREEDLDNDEFEFLSDGVNDCWKKLSSHINSLKFSVSIEDSVDEYRLSSGFENRKQLTKVVWCNYLCSFENILRYKKQIIEVIAKSTGELPTLDVCVDALNILIGSTFAKEVCPILEKELKNIDYIPKSPYLRWMQEADKAKALIPEDRMSEYLSEVLQIVHIAPSLSTSLSLIFEYLRIQYGLINNRHKEYRIRIGETFESLAKIISTEYYDTDFLLAIHKWIDERIDLGVVVPKYERIPIALGNYAWRRFFRAGEREDIFMDISRLALRLYPKSSKEDVMKDIASYCKHLCNVLVYYDQKYINQVPYNKFCESPHRIDISKIDYSNMPFIIMKFYIKALKKIKGIKRILFQEETDGSNKQPTAIALF